MSPRQHDVLEASCHGDGDDPRFGQMDATWCMRLKVKLLVVLSGVVTGSAGAPRGDQSRRTIYAEISRSRAYIAVANASVEGWLRDARGIAGITLSSGYWRRRARDRDRVVVAY